MTERCLETDYECFTRMLAEEGAIGPMELEIYLQHYHFYRSRSTPVRAIVLVDVEPEECARRVQRRARPGEQHIPLEYLRRLDEQTRRWIASCESAPGGIPVLRTPADSPRELDRAVAFIEQFRAI